MESTNPHSEFSQLELQEAINTFRTGLSVLVQIITVMVIANVSILGYAISEKFTGVIFLGALIPVLIIILTRLVSKLLVPAVYTAYTIEKSNSITHHDTLMRIGISVLSSAEFLENFDKISAKEGLAARADGLRKLQFSLLGPQEKMIFAILALLSLVQITIPFVLTFLFEWRMFQL